MSKFIICVHCAETLIELDDKDDDTKNYLCDDCYMLVVEPDVEAGEGYYQ